MAVASEAISRSPFVISRSSMTPEGRKVQQKNHEAWSASRRTWNQSVRDSEIEVQIERVATEAGRPGWDCYGAEALDGRSADIGKEFLYLLPESIPLPRVAVDPDGEISFDWYGREGWEISISISRIGILSYSADYGGLRYEHGQDFFQDEPPAEILAKIEKVCSSASAQKGDAAK